MLKLNDTHSLLLSTASQRESGSILPLPDGAATGARIAKAITALIKAGFVQERETSDPAAEHRTDGDLHFGLFVTAAGLQAIGIEPENSADSAPQAEIWAPSVTPVRTSKTAAVIALLGREEGATLPELIAATGWLPHTTRAALTGLRKKGHAISRGKRDGATCYKLASA